MGIVGSKKSEKLLVPLLIAVPAGESGFTCCFCCGFCCVFVAVAVAVVVDDVAVFVHQILIICSLQIIENGLIGLVRIVLTHILLVVTGSAALLSSIGLALNEIPLIAVEFKASSLGIAGYASVIFKLALCFGSIFLTRPVDCDNSNDPL